VSVVEINKCSANDSSSLYVIAWRRIYHIPAVWNRRTIERRVIALYRLAGHLMAAACIMAVVMVAGYKWANNIRSAETDTAIMTGSGVATIIA
jgi:hypothetical protein